jgi:Flp pilus assembly protein TadG
MARFGSRNGQAIILVVVAASLILIGGLGFAIDGGQVYAQRQMAQAAADAAAEAGIMSIMRGTNATATSTFGTGATPIASHTCTTSDGRTPCVYARNNGFGGTAADTVTLSYPSSVSGVSTLAAVTVPVFQVTVQRTLKTGFIQFLKGPSSTTVSAKAIAGIVGTVSPNSIIVLGSGANAFQASNGATVSVSGGGILVDSNNSSAVTLSGGATVTAASFAIVGSDSITNGASANPSPTTGASSVPDPFISLPAPTVGSCNFTNYTLGGGATQTLNPGTYCGGITIGNGATATYNPGMYIINGGGLNLAGGTTNTGAGVTFYLTGTNATYSSVSISNGVSATFSAPTTGTYTGILFYQDRTVSTASNATFSGGSSMTLTGSLYFPTTSVLFSNGAGAAGYTAIVASKVSFTGGTSIKYDSTGAKTGLFQSGVSLLQ